MTITIKYINLTNGAKTPPNIEGGVSHTWRATNSPPFAFAQKVFAYKDGLKHVFQLGLSGNKSNSYSY